jgi:hypothetical protein
MGLLVDVARSLDLVALVEQDIQKRNTQHRSLQAIPTQ